MDKQECIDWVTSEEYIDTFLKLENNWNDEGSRPPNEKTVKLAKEMHKFIFKLTGKKEQAFPCNDGTIRFEIDYEGIDGNAMIDVWVDD